MYATTNYSIDTHVTSVVPKYCVHREYRVFAKCHNDLADLARTTTMKCDLGRNF